MSGYTTSEIESFIAEADLAVQAAQEVRDFHRKRTARDDVQRVADIEIALERIKNAMRPLRSEIGRFPKQPPTTNNLERQGRIREASLALQRERRKLWKMKNDPTGMRTK
jgi:hypothetical protein